MISVVIADDEPLARYKLHNYVSAVPSLRVAAVCHDGNEALTAAISTRAELLFLDVRMPGLSGTEVVASLDKVPAVVFTTAYDAYAVQAFNLGAVDYLLKPFGRRRFLETIDRVQNMLTTSSFATDGTGSPDRLLVREGDRITPIHFHTITRFEARDDHVMVHTVTHRHLATVRMHELEQRLDHNQFVRVHRSHIVNLDHINTIKSHRSGRLVITMMDGTKLFASRARSHTLRQASI